MVKPNFTINSNIGSLEITLNVFLFKEMSYSEAGGLTVEDGGVYFQGQQVIMNSHPDHITLSDYQTLFSFGLSEEQVQEIRGTTYVIITSIYKI